MLVTYSDFAEWSINLGDPFSTWPRKQNHSQISLIRGTTICDFRTWVSWRNNVDMLCSTSFSLSPQCWLELGQVYRKKKHFKTTLEGRKTCIRALWPKLSVRDCSFTGNKHSKNLLITSRMSLAQHPSSLITIPKTSPCYQLMHHH